MKINIWEQFLDNEWRRSKAAAAGLGVDQFFVEAASFVEAL